MWETTDSDGRRVTLSRQAWAHIAVGHADLRCNPHQILEAVCAPDRRLLDRRPGEEWFYARALGPSRWLKVVVHYEGGAGRIVTAFARRSFP